jgi:excisionase family DNA binding protein
MGTCVKIGYATKLESRMAQLCLPMSAVVGTLPGGVDLEKDLHARFADSRIDGSEWFVITPHLEEFLSSVPKPWRPRSRSERERAAAAERRAAIPDRLLHDVSEAAVLLDTTEDVVWQLLHERKLPMLRIGRDIRTTRAAIDALSENARLRKRPGRAP